MCFMFAKNPRFLKCRFESQGSQMRGTDHIPVTVHGKLGLLLQNLIISQLVKNFPDFLRQNGSFLDAFAKLPKATVSLFMSVIPYGTAGFPLNAPQCYDIRTLPVLLHSQELEIGSYEPNGFSPYYCSVVKNIWRYACTIS